MYAPAKIKAIIKIGIVYEEYLRYVSSIIWCFDTLDGELDNSVHHHHRFYFYR